ncbi:DNA-dependent RNA polymerase subunit epsilon [Lederbergia citrea]|uniref:DNA-directed RNA polymerase subunit epsilon n=1 Tax=Lederbergia citrea TaxID=2833581 RepID=A0A942Z2H4_9BACI|nr:DNA-directed RNA polymerase subunit epsilon [Lederbergia citrea]MBS4177279.1 DNA-dependent RNA polymerase auxiliary subunit epsilon family protein [Lederbergia citrea]MBS4203942.1 DNA-dependent RNA polymerase auxiliary subunit epsilon family protein [Lederbergia citrea]MBS4221474.1 DNA-dependent RNA polymerase auxiliary subunit epsilon family protein [Lederbergia citrea]
MIYKVYYQDSEIEMPVREKTKTLYIEAENERAVRYKLKDRPYNIELVQLLEGSHLDYEKQSENFKLQENV